MNGGEGGGRGSGAWVHVVPFVCLLTHSFPLCDISPGHRPALPVAFTGAVRDVSVRVYSLAARCAACWRMSRHWCPADLGGGLSWYWRGPRRSGRLENGRGGEGDGVSGGE